MTKKEFNKQREQLNLKKFDLVLVGDTVYEFKDLFDDYLGLDQHHEDDELDFNNDLAQMKIIKGEWLDDNITLSYADDKHGLYKANYKLLSGDCYKYKLIG